MSYYINNGTDFYSDTIENGKLVEDAYHYKTLLDPNSNKGIYYYLPSFYIKDGSKPWFDPEWEASGPITSFDARHLCIGRMTISSISSKYSLPQFNNYYIVSNTTPELYKYDVFKPENGKYVSQFNTLDLDVGGKIYWRIPTYNLSSFNFNDYGMASTDGKNVLHNWFLNENFVNDRAFIFVDKDSYTTLSPSSGRFIKAEPTYYPQNKYGFTTYNVEDADNAPAHFTINKNDIPNTYSKLRLKIDALVLAGNNSFNEPYETKAKINTQAINTYASFSANTTQPGTNPYCFALFYKTDNDTQWHIPRETFDNVHPYLNDGSTFSNLKSNGSLKPLIKDKNHYKIKYIKYNNSEIKEEQKLTNKNVWNHSRFLYLSTGMDKLYTDIRNEVSPCKNITAYTIHKQVIYQSTTSDYWYIGNTARYDNEWTNDPSDAHIVNYRDYDDAYLLRNQIPPARYTNFKVDTAVNHFMPCPICTDEDYQGVSGIGSVMCNATGLGVGALNRIASNTQFPYWTQGDYTRPAGFSSYYRWSAGLNCCNGKGFVYMYYRSGDKLYKTSNTASCPVCNGNSSVSCKCVDTTTTFTSAGHDDWGKNIEDYNLRLSPPVAGRVHCTKCWENEGTEPNKYLPYKDKDVLYRFKFYGKNMPGKKTYQGFIFRSNLLGITASNYYTSADWVDDEDWDSVAPAKILPPNPTAKNDYELYGVYAVKKTVPEDFTDLSDYYTDINMQDYLSASNVKTSANWIIYVHDNFKNADKYYYSESHVYNPSVAGVNGNDHYQGVWYNKTSSTDTTILDDYGNPIDLYKWNITGNTPACATNFTFANVELTYDINLDECSGNYLHIAYPYTTIFNSPTVAYNSMLIPQISMSYQAIE